MQVSRACAGGQLPNHSGVAGTRGEPSTLRLQEALAQRDAQIVELRAKGRESLGRLKVENADLQVMRGWGDKRNETDARWGGERI